MSWQIQCHTCNAWRIEVPDAFSFVIAVCEKCGVREAHEVTWGVQGRPEQGRPVQTHPTPEEHYQALRRG